MSIEGSIGPPRLGQKQVLTLRATDGPYSAKYGGPSTLGLLAPVEVGLGQAHSASRPDTGSGVATPSQAQAALGGNYGEQKMGGRFAGSHF